MRYFSVVFLLLTQLAYATETTELILYQAFGTPHEQNLPVIIAKLPGKCSQQSQRIKREDAWQCEANGKIYDPCFVKAYGNTPDVVCPKSPWNNDSVQITLTHGLDNSQHLGLDMSKTYPWAVELDNGETCEAVNEGETRNDLEVFYRCMNNNLLIGHLQRCKTHWSILQYQQDGQINTVLIKKAWF